VSNVIEALNEERTRAARRLAALDAALKALGHEGEVKVKRTWKMSAAARAKISAAQKKRWAKIKK
jgi:aspartate aminotransferase-like enzyme